MTARRSTAWLAALLLAASAAGCSFRDRANPAHGCGESCPAGHCYLGYCLTDATGIPAGTSGVSGGGSGNTGTPGGVGSSGSGGGGAGTGVGTGSGAPTTMPQGDCVQDATCYLAAAETRGKGSCRDGKAHCDGTHLQTCVGQITPTTESCNGIDDDCDGSIDEELDLGSCAASGQGACGAGVMKCEQGVAVCRAGSGPSPEVCNGIDDDCDGTIDNGTDVACYPTDMPGCSANGNGGYDCQGVCAAGKSLCKDGKLEACAGFVQPSQEVCGGAQAADENCNGQIDDGCACTGSATQSCYGGRAGTAGVGICRAGTQTCQDGAFGPCEGSVVPGSETCGNLGADDDCNGFRDDVPGLGLLCLDFAKQGVCFVGLRQCSGGALRCVTPAPQPAETACDGADEDCDGSVDEDFPLATDEQNCGACGTRCASDQLCCGGSCTQVRGDAKNCGACGNACGASSACCGGACVPTTTADHCGGCGGCSAGQACCGSACVPTNTVDHCGGCGGCSSGQACCGGACVDTNTTDHCGGCAGCTSGQACCGSACVATNTTDHCGGCAGCTSAQACCGSACVDTSTVDHCGGCTACTTGQACCGGLCKATDSDDQNCGGCGLACNGTDCHCASGQCKNPGGVVCP